MNAISLIMKLRGSNRSPVEEFLVQIFVFYCLMTDVVVVADHIPGVLNTLADILSRDICLQEEYDLEDTSKEENLSSEQKRRILLRGILKKSIASHQSMHLQDQLKLVKELL